MEKSLTATIIEAKQKIAEIVNDSKLEPIIWQYIFKDYLEEITILINQQLQKEKSNEEGNLN